MSYLSRALWSAGALVIAGAGVGAYAYFGAYKTTVEDAAKRVEDSHLLKLDPSYVIGGEVYAKGTTTKWKRTRSGYALTEPIEAPGDSETFERMMGALAELKVSSELGQIDDSSAARYGLDKPPVRIVFEIFEGQPVEVRVGTKNEFDGRYYVLNAATKRVGLAEPDFLRRVEKDLYALRDKRVVYLNPEEVLGYELIKEGKVRYRLDKKGEDFMLIAPEVKPADTLEVVRMLDALLGLTAKTFIDDSGTADRAFLAKYGLEVPMYRVTFKLTGDRALSLPIGGARSEIGQMLWYARVEGTKALVEIHETFYRTIDRDAVELEDRYVLRFPQASVARISIAQNNGETIELSKTGAETWSLVKPEARPAKAYKVSALLYALSNMRAQSFDTTAPKADDLKRTDLGRRKVTLSDGDGKELATLLVGKESEDTAYVGSNARKRIDIIEVKELNAVPKTAAEL